MSEVGDSKIKLFGKTIGMTHEKGLRDSSTTTNCVHHHDNPSCSASTASNENKITSQGDLTQSKLENERADPTEDSFGEPDTSSGLSDDCRIHDADKETSSPKSIKNDDQSEEKVLKKPDKLIPCPRCNSMETKFCYYNNYNVNQPRYFCKKCQRYWTAGGTMRNVPVGSGRRKNKSSSTSNYFHLNVPDALQSAHGMHLPALRPNGAVLTFGSDKPLCDSMASVLNLAEKSQNSTASRFSGSDQRMPSSCGGKEFGNNQSNAPCSTASILTEKENNSATHDDVTWKSFQAFHPQVPYFPGPPWQYSGYPVSFYPPPLYWGCTVANPWNVPWLFSDQSADNSSPTSPTLGKHSRDGSMLNQSQSGRGDTLLEPEAERSVLIPKTLRIDDPNEAAKSSIWSTLGIKHDKNDSVRGERLFKAFNSKADPSNHESDTSLVLLANPAALSRSLNFRESTQ